MLLHMLTAVALLSAAHQVQGIKVTASASNLGAPASDAEAAASLKDLLHSSTHDILASRRLSDHDGQDHGDQTRSGGGDTSGGSSTRSFQTFPRNIWIFWKQGLIENEAAVRCIQSWRTRNPNWNLTVVSDTTLPTFIAGKDATLIQSIKSKQSSSDLARVALLERLGGVYADVDVYNVLSLDDWLPQYVEPTGTWVPSMKGRDRPVVSWFIASFPGTDIIREWKQSIFAHARKHGKFQRYFQLHYEFGTLLRTNPSFQTQWAHTPHIDATISSSDTCCTVVLPHGSQFPRVKFRRKGGFMVALTAQAKQMIDSGAIPIIKGSKRSVDTPPQPSIMDYLDLIGTMGSVTWSNARRTTATQKNATPSKGPPAPRKDDPLAHVASLRFLHIPKTGGTTVETLGKELGLRWGMYDDRFRSKSAEHRCSAWHVPQRPAKKGGAHERDLRIPSDNYYNFDVGQQIQKKGLLRIEFRRSSRCGITFHHQTRISTLSHCAGRG